MLPRTTKPTETEPNAAATKRSRSLRAQNETDTAHSLNTLTHFGEQLRVRYDDPDGHDKLYRFAESIQEFFDLSARLDFAYPDGSRPPAARAERQRSAR